jgi:hypothetical protein
MKTKATLMFLALVFLLAGAAETAFGKDAVGATVSKATGSPVIVNNGNANANGTFAIGTIQLFYTVNAYQFTAGTFATFDVDWTDIGGYSSGPATNYSSGVTLYLDQIGGTDVILSPNPASFPVTYAGQTGVSTVTISINGNVPSDPALNCDGCELVGNLRLGTAPSGAHLDTVTNIQVHIKLVHPTNCLKVYNFLTDQDFTMGILSSTTVKVKNGVVKSSNPGQYSDNVLIANTCASDQYFDLGIVLDPSFQTNPHDNPGQAVFTYSSSGIVDPTIFNITSFGTGSPQGQNLCLQDVKVTGGTTFLATVHSEVIKGLAATSLPSDGDLDFSASLYQNVNSGCTGAMDSLATPDPAYFSLPFTIN